MATWFARPTNQQGGGWVAGNNNAQPIYGPVGTLAVVEQPAVIGAIFNVQIIRVTHTFKDSLGNPLPNGINVVVFQEGTLSGANPVVLGAGVTSGNTGTVSVVLNKNVTCIMVPDHTHASFPTGEVGHSPTLTPTVV